MAIARVSSDADSRTYPSGTSGSNTWGSNTTTGNSVVVHVFWKNDVTITSVTDSQGSTYVDCGAGRLARPTDGYIQTLGATNITGGTTPTVTVNFSGTAASIIIDLVQYSGQDTTDLWDVSATGTATSGTTVTTGSYTPNVTDGAVAVNVQTSDTNVSAGTNHTLVIDGADGTGVLERLFTSSIGTTTSSATLSTSISKGGIIAGIIKAAVAASGFKPNLCGQLTPVGEALIGRGGLVL